MLSSKCAQFFCVEPLLHGFNQGSHTLRDIIHELKPDICMLHEHLPTPANMSKLDDGFPQYLCSGTSAKSSTVESSILYGRPFGGVAILVSKHLVSHTQLVFASDRYGVIRG